MARNQFELNPKYVSNTAKALKVIGSGLLIAEVIAGIFAIDLAIFIILKNQKSNHEISFLSGYLWGKMSQNHVSLWGNSLLYISMGSFVQSMIAGILLTVEFGMPMIAIGVASAWVASIAMIAAGEALQRYGDKLSSMASASPRPTAPPVYPIPTAPPVYPIPTAPPAEQAIPCPPPGTTTETDIQWRASVFS